MMKSINNTDRGVRKMSVSIHINGKTLGDFEPGIVKHQLRDSESSGRVAKYTKSDIRPEDTKFNHNYFDEIGTNYNEILNMGTTFETKTSMINAKRKKEGKRRIRSNTNLIGFGTIQLSDESLVQMGWKVDGDFNSGKYSKLPAGDQSQEVLDRVRETYDKLVQSTLDQPEVFGHVYSASLHMDEGTPHVDLMTDMIKPQDIKGGGFRSFARIDGVPGTGLKLMQDKIVEGAHFDKAEQDKYDLYRGESDSDKKQRVKNNKARTRVLDVREKELDTREENLRASENALESQKSTFKAQQSNFNTLVDNRAEEKANTKVQAYKDKLDNQYQQDVNSAVNDRTMQLGATTSMAVAAKKSAEKAKEDAEKAQKEAEAERDEMQATATNAMNLAGRLFERMNAFKDYMTDIFNKFKELPVDSQQRVKDTVEKDEVQNFTKGEESLDTAIDTTKQDWGDDENIPNYEEPDDLNGIDYHLDDLDDFKKQYKL